LLFNFIPGHHHAELTLPISQTCASTWAAWVPARVPPEVVRGVVGHAVQVHGETAGEVTGVEMAQCGDRIGEPAGREAP